MDIVPPETDLRVKSGAISPTLTLRVLSTGLSVPTWYIPSFKSSDAASAGKLVQTINPAANIKK